MEDGEETFAKTSCPEMFMPQNRMDVPAYPGYQPWHGGQGARDRSCCGKKPKSHQARRRRSSSSDDSESTSAGNSDAGKSLSSGDDVAATTVSNSSLPSATRTSVIMRNVPNELTRDMLVALLDEQGFAGCYNFVYLPMDFQTQHSLGYAFITLFANDEAERLYKHFAGFTAWPQVSEKVCAMSWSDLNGLQAHVDRYRNSPVQHASVPDKFKPALFDRDGERVEFPAPTKHIRPPRFKTLAAKLAKPQNQVTTQCS